MIQGLLGIVLLPSITSLALMALVVLLLLVIVSLLVVMVFQQNDPHFIKNGGLLGVAFRTITGRNPTLGEQFLILSPVMVFFIIAFWL
jgi:hypothetical protein